MVASVVVLGLVVAAALSAAAGSPQGDMPGVALGSMAMLVAERTVGLFAMWMLVAMVVIRAFRNQLPIEISGRGVRFAEAEDVRAKTISTEDVLRDVDVEMRWLRKAVLDLRSADADGRREERVDDR